MVSAQLETRIGHTPGRYILIAFCAGESGEAAHFPVDVYCTMCASGVGTHAHVCATSRSEAPLFIYSRLGRCESRS